MENHQSKAHGKVDADMMEDRSMELYNLVQVSEKHGNLNQTSIYSKILFKIRSRKLLLSLITDQLKVN